MQTCEKTFQAVGIASVKALRPQHLQEREAAIVAGAEGWAGGDVSRRKAHGAPVGGGVGRQVT